jgi:hypothetical protein
MLRPAAVSVFVACAVASVGAVQMTLDRRAIEEAIYIGQSRIERDRERFHVPYRVRVTQPPIDWIDVITPFHRIELAAERNARIGGRQFSQREAMDILRETANEIDLLIEMTFHPLNTFVTVPSYEVELIPASGGSRIKPKRLDRFPRFGPRADSVGPAFPAPNASAVFGGGQPVVGGTMIAVLDGSTFDPQQRLQVVVLDGKTELGRAPIELATMR